MADTIKVGDSYECFGFRGDIHREILDVIEERLGYQFAEYVKSYFITSYADGLEDIIWQCNNFDPKEDKIEDVLDEIRLIAESTISDNSGYYG